jgi:hypothetical protein
MKFIDYAKIHVRSGSGERSSYQRAAPTAATEDVEDT